MAGIPRFGSGHGTVVIDRGDYFQCAYLIRKGTDATRRAEGIETFRRRVAAMIPWLGDRVEAVSDWGRRGAA